MMIIMVFLISRLGIIFVNYFTGIFTPPYPSEKSRYASAGRVLFVTGFRRNKIFAIVVSHREDYNWRHNVCLMRASGRGFIAFNVLLSISRNDFAPLVHRNEGRNIHEAMRAAPSPVKSFMQVVRPSTWRSFV